MASEIKVDTITPNNETEVTLNALASNSVNITGGTISGLTTLGASAAAITGGTISGLTTLGASAAAITGGTVTGITDITVADGGTGRSTATAYAVLCGGTTSTAAHQSIVSVGTAGQTLTSNGASQLPTFQSNAGWTIVSKTADQAVDGTTLTNDTHISFAIVSGNIYAVRMFLQYTTTATADLKFKLNNPGGIAEYSGIAISNDGTAIATFPSGIGVTTSVTGGGTTLCCVELSATVRATANQTIQLQWAQNTDDGANTTTVHAGSFLEYKIVGV